MGLEYGSPAARKFITTIGLITSDGPWGPNIMAAEWTHHISYNPGLIAVFPRPSRATTENIKKTKVFGVNIAAIDQNVISSIAGGNTGKEIDKIAVLKELGFEFYPAKKIKVLMVKGAAANIECKLVKTVKLGDHTMFVGKALEVSSIEKESIAYNGGKYYRLGEKIEKPPQEVLDKIAITLERHKKK
ncbi:MAG: flavin reductase family protein [Candidatus Aenigmarchaeota archaeon]|nr:flavin reductase family protein [Candidatus Aenigmarchaeota archaeon]